MLSDLHRKRGSYTTWTDLERMLEAYQENRSPQLRNRITLATIPVVIKQARRWCDGDLMLMDDLTQDAIVFVLQAIERRWNTQEFATPRNFLMWLLKSIHFQVMRTRMKPVHDYKTLSFDADVSDFTQFQVALHFYDPSLDDTEAEIEAMIEELGEKYAPIVEMVWIDGYSAREASIKLGIKESEIKQRLKKARSTLGRQLLKMKAA